MSSALSSYQGLGALETAPTSKEVEHSGEYALSTADRVPLHLNLFGAAGLVMIATTVGLMIARRR